MSKLSVFVALVVATLKGDEAEATGLKIQKRASAAIRAQIAAKEAKTLELEDTVDSAKEALEKAFINSGNLIDNNAEYIRVLLVANRTVKEAEEALANHKEEIVFLSTQLVKATA